MSWNIPAISPPRPIPPNPGTVSDKVHILREIASRAKELAAAQTASERACDQRQALDAGTSRARLTSANAKWMRAAEHRDRCERNFIHALEAGNFTRSQQ
jgi:hypothetical protein